MKILSAEHKKAISDGIAKAHREKRHPGWQSANRKHKSYPEKLFEQIARQNEFFEKYEVIDQYPFHGYFFDFAIVDCLLDLEIDGVQHYRTEKAIKYDENRNMFVEAKGWKVYRMSAKELKDNPIGEFQKLVEFIESEKTYRCYDRSELLKYFVNKNLPKYGDSKAYRKAQKNEYESKNVELIEKVKTSGIDFSKFGWVNKVAILLDKKPQKVNIWMKRFMPEVYFNDCFKKRTK